MTDDLRKQLLNDVEILSHREAENVDQPKTFLPLPTHCLALRPEIVVIRGGRGAGKSALFKLLDSLKESEKLREFFKDDRIPEARWLDAFSQIGMNHPEVGTLDALAAASTTDSTLRAFWMVHLLRRLKIEIPTLPCFSADVEKLIKSSPDKVRQWSAEGEDKLAQVATSLDEIERHLQEAKQHVFASYDHLDRIGAFDPVIRRRFVATLLALWLSLSNRYKFLRAKIFLREDLFEAGEIAFPDASKLRPRSIAIEWDVESLYRVVIRHLASTSSEMREWLQTIKVGNQRLKLEVTSTYGWMPPLMPQEMQKAFVDHLAGELMGAGVKKGYTYRWIPNRLQDANVRIVPRSMLCLLGFAAREALKKPPHTGDRLITPANLVAALEDTSKARVNEISEEYPLVQRIDNLRGLIVPLSRHQVLAKLGEPTVGEHAGSAPPGKLVMEELIRLGVLAVRSDDRIDVPDIYRYGYKILRKGGVRRPT